MHLRRPEFTCIWLFFLVLPEIFTTTTPTKPHIPRDVRGSEFSGYTGQRLLILFVQNVPYGLQRRVTFRVMSLFESLYPLPCYRCHYSACNELREVVCRVVVCTGHHLWPEPSFCEFTRGPVLIVDTSTNRLPRYSSVRVASVRVFHRALILVRASFILAVPTKSQIHRHVHSNAEFSGTSKSSTKTNLTWPRVGDRRRCFPSATLAPIHWNSVSTTYSTEISCPSGKLRRNQPNPKQAADQLTGTGTRHGPDTSTTTGAETTITREMTIATVITIAGTIITVAMMTMIGTMTTVLTIISTTITTPTDGSPETTKGSTGSRTTCRKMCTTIDGDHPPTTGEGHATDGPTHHSYKSNMSDNWCR